MSKRNSRPRKETRLLVFLCLTILWVLHRCPGLGMMVRASNVFKYFAVAKLPNDVIDEVIEREEPPTLELTARLLADQCERINGPKGGQQRELQKWKAKAMRLEEENSILKGQLPL